MAGQSSLADAFKLETKTMASLIGSPNNVEAVTAYFEIRYSVRDVGSNRSRQGRADEVWTISKPFGALKIISEKETVHGEAPERHQIRRH